MLETDIRKIDFWSDNILKLNTINLDTDMDCIILMSCYDKKFLDLVYHKIVDSIIDRIHSKNVYKDFSNSLENINAFLSGWMNDSQKIQWFKAVIGIYHKKNFFFSTVGSASCYLYNTHKDVIEITDRDESPKDFSFISSGDVSSWESLILSTYRLLDTLSKDDIKDWLVHGWVERAGENIERILLHEHTGKNIGLIVLQKQWKWKNNTFWVLEKTTHYTLKLLDNKISKKCLSYVYLAKRSIIDQWQKTRQILLGFAILLCAGLLYYIVAWFFSFSSSITWPSEWAKNNLITAQNHIITASENMNNIDVFSFNIDAAQDIIKDLESQNLFLNDLSKLRDETGVLQKQFNGISPFETSPENLVASFQEPQQIVKILSISGDVYAVNKKSILGPIIQGQAPEEFIFQDIGEDYFIDAAVYGSSIILVTQSGKIVEFSKTKIFSYVDVKNQTTWEKSPIIDSYADNLYLLSDTGNQILRHKRSGESYDAGIAYLSDADATDIGNILSLAVDGWIYILKQDGSIVKLFRSPQYRLESMNLNNLPRNYDFRDIDLQNPPEIKTALNLKYVYMLLQDRILVFQPNSLRYQDVKSLKYLWQIEGKDIVIEDFYVENDGQIFIATSTGVYKAEFDIVEDKLILK